MKTPKMPKAPKASKMKPMSYARTMPGMRKIKAMK